MARQRLYEYSFTPGTAGLGTVKVPDRYNLADFLAIYDTTTNTSIYNFSDSSQGGTVTWAAGVTADFPTAYAGVTTLTLDLDTSTLSATDKLAIYVESQSLKTEPWEFGEDAIGRNRVANPQSLIDADFEYGLQNTKWQNFSLTQYIPNFYEDVGADLILNTNGYVTMISSTNTLTANNDTSINAADQGTAPWITDDYALIISQTQGNTTPFVSSHLTANVNSSAERTFTVASTTGLAALDNILWWYVRSIKPTVWLQIFPQATMCLWSAPWKLHKWMKSQMPLPCNCNAAGTTLLLPTYLSQAQCFRNSVPI
jgi:hypothetical protein